MSNKYILINKEAVIEPDLLKWAKWFETKERIIKQENVKGKMVSTVFLGIDHNFYNEGKPILFETMIFGDGQEYQERCSTWEEAEEQHKKAVKSLK